MATFSTVNEYLLTIDQYIKEINYGNNFEVYTRPTMLKIAAASFEINSGNLLRYVNMITEAANQVYNATNDLTIQMGFYAINIAVDMLRNYLAGHWWQYGGGNGKQHGDYQVPLVAELKITH